MKQTYAYRQTGSRRVIWFSAIAAATLLVYGIREDIPHTVPVTLVFIFLIIGWLKMTHNVRGIRVGENNLTLNAWRDPKPIPLAEIAYLRAEHWTNDSAITIVYVDGTEERTNPRDMPPVDVLTEVMAERGVRVRDPVDRR